MAKIYTIKGRFPVLPSHVNSYVVELDKAVVVVDATAAISSATQLREKADSLAKPVQAVLMTHGHPDHFTGLVKFADLPRYASQGCIDFARQEDAEKWRSGKVYLGDDFPDERVFPDQVVADGAQLEFGGTIFTFQDLGGGESDAAGLWWFQDEDAVTHAFIGDTISNNCHSFFGDGQALHWLQVLDRLETMFDEKARFYIGHGDTPVGISMIDVQRQYIKHFIHLVQGLDRGQELNEQTLQPVVAAMHDYLPTDDLLFLLAYQLEKGIPRIWAGLDAEHASTLEVTRA